MLPPSFYHPEPTHSASTCFSTWFFVTLSCVYIPVSVSFSCPFCISCLTTIQPPLLFHRPFLSWSLSLYEGLGRAPLIGSVWCCRQSDLERVTNEVRSASCLAPMPAATVTALIYVAQPLEPLHTQT